MATRVHFQRRESALCEQRTERRHKVDGAWVTGSGEEVGFHAVLEDISSFGCRLSGVPALESGGRIWLRMPDAVPVPATVTWTRDAQAGCRFVDPISQGLMRSLLPGAV